MTTAAYQGRLVLVFLPLGAAVNKIKSVENHIFAAYGLYTSTP